MRTLTINTIVLLVTGISLHAQTHFTYTALTGSNAQAGIPVTANPTISGVPLSAGDEIGAFSPAGLCVGAIVWTATSTGVITVWGDDPQSPQIDGMRDGEMVSYRVWKQSTNTEYTSVRVTYSEGDGVYRPNSVHVLSSLTAIAPPDVASPTSPMDGAVLQPAAAILQWTNAARADQYRIRVSTDSTFATVNVNDSSTGTSYQTPQLAYATWHYWQVRAENSGGVSDWSATSRFMTIGTPMTHGIIVRPGWNMISGFVQPTDTDIETLCASILENMVIIKNGDGQVYWPAIPANSIGTWNHGDGYQVYMQATDTLLLPGNEIVPVINAMSLTQGWHLISYMRNGPLSVDSALSTIRSNIVIVKNNAGQVYWPALSFDSIGELIPGQGYQIYLSAASTLTYPPNGQSSPGDVVTQRAGAGIAVRSPFAFRTTTGNSSTVGLPAGFSNLIEPGDFVGVFTPDGVCAGAVAWNGSGAALTVWGDDSQTQAVDGMRSGELMEFRVWKSVSKEEIRVTVNYAEGNGTYAKDALAILRSANASGPATTADAGIIPARFSLKQNYPNPFNPSTVIRYELPQTELVSLVLFDVLGREVARLVDGMQPAGFHSVPFDAASLPSGIYWYRIDAGSFTQVRKMLLVR